MIIEARTPNRVDLAGGTLDIFPLYLIEEGGLTVNLAIDLMSIARVETRADRRIVIVSEDLNEREEFASADDIAFGGPLDLLCRIVRFYRPPTGVTVTTRNSVRKGSGLGASSALLIALSGALNRLLDDQYSREQIIEIGSRLEAQSIRTLTGKQDYYAAMCGGLNAIWFGIAADRVEPIGNDQVCAELNARLVLTFAGEPRFSGLTNWTMVRSYLDGNPTTLRNMKEVKASALAVYESLMRGDLDAFGRSLKREWEFRRGLAEGVSNERVDRMVAAAEKGGAIASKLCGAGGGGCLLSLARSGRRDAVVEALVSAGADHIDFRVEPKGLQITVRGS